MKKQAGILAFAVLSGLINLVSLFLTQNPAFSIRSGVLGFLSFAVVGIFYLLREDLPPPQILTSRTRAHFSAGVLAMLVFAFCVDYFPRHSAHIVSSLGFGLFLSMLALMILKSKPESVLDPEYEVY